MDPDLLSRHPRTRLRRSVLFVPGSRPDRFARALASGADAVCLDLEDGVAPAAKDEARDAVVRFLEARLSPGDGATSPPAAGGPPDPELVVRVNDPRAWTGRRDLDALAGVPLPDALMVPKVDGPESLEVVAEVLGTGDAGPPVLPLVETARGLAAVEEIAASSLRVAGLVFGGMDLAVELGARFAWEPLLFARSRVVHAAALAGVGAVDVPFEALDDPDGLAAETRRAAALGFTGKLAIHPAQVAPIHAALAPGAAEADRARRIVEAAEGAAGGVVVVDGRMVDRPIVEAARRVLARAGEAGDR